jgi:hypothetical protein
MKWSPGIVNAFPIGGKNKSNLDFGELKEEI